MKKLLPQVIVLLFMSLSGYAQNKGKSQIEASYGLFSNEELVYDLLNRVIDVFVTNNSEVTKRSGSVFLTYKYFALERLAFGATTGFNRFEKTNFFGAHPN